MKVYFDTVGCRLNQSEIEKYATQFHAAGHEVVDNAGDADVVIINTCAVTAEAGSDSRQKIRQAQKAGQARIILTGCWSELEPEKAAAMPNVDLVIPNAFKDSLVNNYLGLSANLYEFEPLVRAPLPGVRRRTRAFIKTQDGCDNFCTFCVTRLVRGKGRSEPMDEILQDIHAAIDGGAHEVVLSGVNLGSWGRDFDPPLGLSDLVEKILAQTSIARLRFSSLEPWDIDRSFFELWQDQRVCRHLHLPLQSGSDKTLRRMGRRINTKKFTELAEQARSAVPDLALTTDILVGFPGETQADFDECLAFVEQMQFASGHVFTYSARPGTPAAEYKDQVNGRVQKERSLVMRTCLDESSKAFNARFIGQTMKVLWESADQLGPQGWRMHGLTDNYVHVCAMAADQLWNQISRVKIERLADQWVEGQICL
jgi:threonylcarbamoyladenosine tRNA methylthiotransferase MtaB